MIRLSKVLLTIFAVSFCFSLTAFLLGERPMGAFGMQMAATAIGEILLVGAALRLASALRGSR